MRNFKITVNGSVYDVSVEETNSGVAASTPVITPIAKPVANTVCVPAQVVKPKNNVCGLAINSPMPGMILSFKVESGATVKKGQVVMVLEAMKMENDISAPADGKITFVASKGATVETGEVLAVIN